MRLPVRDAFNMFTTSGSKVMIFAPGAGKIGDDAVDRPDHQVRVERRCGARAERFADERPDRQAGNTMAAHHVEMDFVGACGDDVGHFLTQPGEVGREDARDSNGFRADTTLP